MYLRVLERCGKCGRGNMVPTLNEQSPRSTAYAYAYVEVLTCDKCGAEVVKTEYVSIRYHNAHAHWTCFPA